MRISGLASGIDTDTMVKQLMQAERIPLDKLKQNKQTLEWKRDDYRSINTLLTKFRQDVLNMKLSSSYRSKTTSSTNEAMVTATATSAASATSYQITKVDKLATAATRVSVGTIFSKKEANNLTTSFKEAGLATGAAWLSGNIETEKVTVTENGQTATLKNMSGTKIIDPDTMNVKINQTNYKVITSGDPGDNEVLVDVDTGILTFKNEISKGTIINVNYVTEKKVDQFALKAGLSELQLTKGVAIGTSIAMSYGSETVQIDGDGNFKIDGVNGKVNTQTGKITFDPPIESDLEETLKIVYEQNQKYNSFSLNTSTSSGEKSENFLVSDGDNLSSVISKVNASSVGVSMFYDSATDKISITRKETGDFNPGDNEIRISGDFADNILRFNGSNETGGQNAEFTINGLNTTRTSNTFAVDGVTFTLKQTFDNAAVTIGINNDTSKVYDNIKGFVDKYNELIAGIQGKTSEERNRGYLPLTDDERDSLSEDEIEKWEKIAKAGLLKNDSILTGVLNNMRFSFSNSISSSTGLYKQLSSIGITTTSDYMAGGKLEINETKLKQALEDDPESVEALFASEDGILSKLQTNISAATDQLKSRAGTSLSTNATFTMGRDLTSIDDRISRFEDRLVQVENRYYKQFTAMEKAIQQANSQSGYLSSMFATG